MLILFIKKEKTPEGRMFWYIVAATLPGGIIGLVQTGDIIVIDIPSRSISVKLSDEELATRREVEESRGKAAFTPKYRNRVVSKALQAYASMVTSADKGGVRE